METDRTAKKPLIYFLKIASTLNDLVLFREMHLYLKEKYLKYPHDLEVYKIYTFVTFEYLT